MQVTKGVIWFKTVTKGLVWMIYSGHERRGFKQSISYHNLFLKHRKGLITALLIYVDDMIVTGNDESKNI